MRNFLPLLLTHNLMLLFTFYASYARMAEEKKNIYAVNIAVVYTDVIKNAIIRNENLVAFTLLGKAEMHFKLNAKLNFDLENFRLKYF